MNQQHFNDARTGNTGGIVAINFPNYQAMSQWTPLHIACLTGKENFAREFLQKNPHFLKLVNPDGWNALHLASSNGYLPIVDLLLRFEHPGDNQAVNRELCLKKDNGGRNPLHHALVKNHIQVVKKLLEACPESALDLTVQEETVFHLAVKNRASPSREVLQVLLRGPYVRHLLNLADKKGNTVLHLAIVRKQIQIIEQLLTAGEHNLDVNAVNSSGLTPLDVLVVDPTCRKDREIQRMIISAGGIRLNESNEQRENLKSITSGLFVVASLIAAASCQIAIYLQGGFWTESILTPGANVTSISNNSTTALEKPWNVTVPHHQEDSKKKNLYTTLVFSDGAVLLFSLSIIVVLLFPTPAHRISRTWISVRVITFFTALTFIFLFWKLVSPRVKWDPREIFAFITLGLLFCFILFLILLPTMRMIKFRCVNFCS